jgi:hypothetical protein
MKIAIMQPYFLPYIGYFQLMKATNIFVFYDDVNFIKQGWINRNRILLNGEDYLFTLELKGASSYKRINTIEIGRNRNKLFRTFQHAYKKAPFYKTVLPILYSIFESSQINLSQFIIDTHLILTSYLDLKIQFLISSQIEKEDKLKGQEMLINICKKLGASEYINLIGGQDLYSKEDFANSRINLKFLNTKKIEYTQYENNFIPRLSIVDVMMFNSKEQISEYLMQYELV